MGDINAKTTGSSPLYPPAGTSSVKAALLALPMLLWGLLMFAGGLRGGSTAGISIRISSILVILFMTVLFYLMVQSGSTYRYRRVFFCTLAVLFPIGFITELIHVRGSMSLSMATILSGNTPFCHLAIPMMMAPVALAKTVIFPGSILPSPENPHAFATMVALWLGATLVLGRAWCAYGCFFGGLDELFSSTSPKKAVIRTIDKKWRLLAWAVLIVTICATLILTEPFYCAWLCPFKVVTEFNKVENFRSAMQFGMMIILFGTLVVTLPFLTKKRVQCSYFCPMGALQSLTNYFNIFTIKTDRSRCNGCKLCVTKCPFNAIDVDQDGKPNITMYCSRCGQCVDVCKKQAARWHIKGTGTEGAGRSARYLFLLSAWMFAMMFGGSTIAKGFSQILALFM